MAAHLIFPSSPIREATSRPIEYKAPSPHPHHLSLAGCQAFCRSPVTCWPFTATHPGPTLLLHVHVLCRRFILLVLGEIQLQSAVLKMCSLCTLPMQCRLPSKVEGWHTSSLSTLRIFDEEYIGACRLLSGVDTSPPSLAYMGSSFSCMHSPADEDTPVNRVCIVADGWDCAWAMSLLMNSSTFRAPGTCRCPLHSFTKAKANLSSSSRLGKTLRITRR